MAIAGPSGGAREEEGKEEERDGGGRTSLQMHSHRGRSVGLGIRSDVCARQSTCLCKSGCV